MAIKRGKIIAVTSVKGGVGKTTTALNIAGALALRKKKVLIIDANLYNGGVSVSLDVDCDKDLYTLTDDLANNRFDYIESYVKAYNKYIDVLAAPKDPRDASKVQSKYLYTVLTKARMRYDIVVVDLNHIMDSNNLIMLDNADIIYYCVTNDLIDVKGIKTMIAIYKDMNKDNYRIILNDAKDRLKPLVSKSDMKNIIKDDLDYIIPDSFYLKNINAYNLSGIILSLDKKVRAKHKKAMKVFENIVDEIIEVGDTNGKAKTSK